MSSGPRRTAPRAGLGDLAAAKEALRHRIGESRRDREPAEHSLSRTLAALQVCAGVPIVACYASRPDEPDTWPLIDALQRSGVTVLLPVLGRLPDGRPRRDPDWAIHLGRDSTRPGLWGIPEPTGPSLGAAALAQAGFIWAPALAVDGHGRRLGTGGGWYDRALAYAAPGTDIGVLVRDDEVLDDVPVEPWDRLVNVVVTESRVVRITPQDPTARSTRGQQDGPATSESAVSVTDR